MVVLMFGPSAKCKLFMFNSLYFRLWTKHGIVHMIAIPSVCVPRPMDFPLDHPYIFVVSSKLHI